jgi:MoxR-like ATPase
VQRVHVSPALLDYVQALVRHTRESPDFANGLSPRAALALVHAARAWALIADRKHVLPEDVQAVLPSVVTHRLPLAIDSGGTGGWESAHRLMQEVAIP